MSEQVGVKNLKELVSFVVSLAQAVANSVEDGKIGVADLFRFLGVLMKAGPAFKDLGSIRAEIKDLSQAEKEELRKQIEQEFEINNNVLEGYIEQALVAAIALLDLIPVFQSSKDVNVPV